MALKFDDLRKLPKSELYKLYDKEAEHVQPSLNYYIGEITRREIYTQTKWIIALTILVLIATIVGAIGVFVK